jgi:hypothetical protein
MTRFTRFILGGLGIIALAASVNVGVARPEARPNETCFYKSERVDNMNKICYYTCTSGTIATTIRSTDLCPLNIKY